MMVNGFYRFGSPFVELPIEGRKIQLLLDTGFNGHIMLPGSIIKELALDQIGVSDYVTASGESKITGVYVGKIMLFDEKLKVSILSTNADFALAGMELFHNCKILIERRKDIVEITKSD